VVAGGGGVTDDSCAVPSVASLGLSPALVDAGGISVSVCEGVFEVPSDDDAAVSSSDARASGVDDGAAAGVADASSSGFFDEVSESERVAPLDHTAAARRTRERFSSRDPGSNSMSVTSALFSCACAPGTRTCGPVSSWPWRAA
jgi:hypothetical protein